MKLLNFKKIDAFTSGVALGNPAGCIYLEEDTVLNNEEMQRIAIELKGFVNEVGYLSVIQDKFYLKYYSAESEVDFCGHATIAIMYDLINENEALKNKEEITIQVNAGQLSVFNRIKEDGAVYIMAPQPQFFQCLLSVNDIAQALKVNISEVDNKLPIKIINAGLKTLLVPLTSLDSCLKVLPDQEQLKSFCVHHDIDIVLVFCKETLHASSHYRTRVFAPRFGYLEDPATGSGNSAFGHYLIEQGLWAGNTNIEQGPSRDIPNIIKLRKYQRAGDDYIIFGGTSVLRIEGKYVLHAK